MAGVYAKNAGTIFCLLLAVATTLFASPGLLNTVSYPAFRLSKPYKQGRISLFIAQLNVTQPSSKKSPDQMTGALY